MTQTADRQALHDVMMTYAAAVDERDMPRYRQCFADDAEIVGFGDAVVRGADRWAASVEHQLAAFSATQHLMGSPLISLSGDKASARTDVQAVHFLREPEGAIFTLWATYKTEFARIATDWKITRHELVIRGTQQ